VSTTPETPFSARLGGRREPDTSSGDGACAVSRATAAGARPTMRQRRFAEGRDPDDSGGERTREI